MTRDEAIKIISERIVSRMLSRPETPELLEVLSDAEHAVDTLVALGVLKLKRVSDELVVREWWSDTRANEWFGPDGNRYSPEDYAALGWRYIAPCPPPKMEG